MPQTNRLIVLDTNVVLDWLVFRDARCAALVRHIQDRQLKWIATPAMRDELQQVLPRPLLQRWKPDAEAVLTRFDRYAHQASQAPQPECRAAAPRCTDPADQKFIDLACAAGARWLISRDRALLMLAAAARQNGVEIFSPEDWRP